MAQGKWRQLYLNNNKKKKNTKNTRDGEEWVFTWKCCFEGESIQYRAGSLQQFYSKRKEEDKNRDQFSGNEAGRTEGQVGIGLTPALGTVLSSQDFSFLSKIAFEWFLKKSGE